MKGLHHWSDWVAVKNDVRCSLEYQSKLWIGLHLVLVKSMLEDESENALSLVENITKFFEDHFAMRDVTEYATHSVGKKRSDGAFCWVIVCTILDECKRAIILYSMFV